MYISASGLVVKSNVAIVGPRVRFSAGALYVLCIRRHGTDMSQKPTFGCVMSVPLGTHICTMSPTCRPTCRQHVGPDISCLTFWTSGQHADIRHIPTKLRMGWRNFFPSCAVVSVFWFLAGNRFWFYILMYLEYNTVVVLC
jgi:hypothetical protein